jgi:hypothetical protein
MHIQQAINDIMQQGLKEGYIKLVGTEKECMSKLEDEKLSLNISQGNCEDSVQVKVVKTATKACENPMEALMSVAN